MKISRGTSTTIECIQRSDITVVNQQVGNSAFKGKRFFGHHDAQKKSTTENTNIYFEVPEQNKTCSEINKKEIQKRAKYIDDISCAVAGSASVEQRQILYTEIKQPKLGNLRTCLSNFNFNVNILPSELKLKKVKAPLVSHVDETTVETGFIGLKRMKNDDVTPCAYLRAKDLKMYIEEIITRDTDGFSYNEKFDKKWWLMFAGDTAATA